VRAAAQQPCFNEMPPQQQQRAISKMIYCIGSPQTACQVRFQRYVTIRFSVFHPLVPTADGTMAASDNIIFTAALVDNRNSSGCTKSTFLETPPTKKVRLVNSHDTERNLSDTLLHVASVKQYKHCLSSANPHSCLDTLSLGLLLS